jgi:tetratricopeptide (TPR) repeat protein
MLKKTKSESSTKQVVLRKEGQSSIKIWLFRLTAMVLMSLLFLGAVEGVLRLVGFGYNTDYFIKASYGSEEYWVENPGFLYRFMPKTQARSPRPVLIPVKKSEDTIRIFVLGESAAMGDPEPAFGMGQVLRLIMEDRYPEKDFEIVNTALTAINSHLILPIARECIDKEADIVVVYMGNNEVVGPFGPGTVFTKEMPNITVLKLGLAFKQFRIGQFVDHVVRSAVGSRENESWSGVAMFKDKHVHPHDPRLTQVYQHFQSQLESLVEVGAKAGVPVFVSNIATNLKDSAPFASVLPETLSGEQKEVWRKAVNDGLKLLRAQLVSEAYLKFQEAGEIEPDHADLQFNMGQCLLRLEDSQKPKSYFVNARELDLLRFRADERVNQIIRDACEGKEKDGVYFVDAIKYFEEQSKDGIPGYDFFWDHVHLKFAGNYLLARLYAVQIAHALSLRGVEITEKPWLNTQECAVRLALTRWGQYSMTNTMVARLNQYPFSEQSNRAELNAKMLEESKLLKLDANKEVLQAMAALYQKAIALDEDNWMLYDQYAKFLKGFGDKENAGINWKKVLELIPHHFMARYELGGLLSASALTAASGEKYLKEATDLRPYIPEVWVELGLNLGRQKRYEDAIEAFQRATELNPKLLIAHVNWAVALNSHEKPDDAVARLEKALTINTNDVSVHLHLARFLVPGKNWDRISHHLKEVLRLDPTHVEATDALSKVETLINNK